MGKFGIWGFLVLAVLFTAGAALAKEGRHATVLPSKVKTIHLLPSRARAKGGARVREVSAPAPSSAAADATRFAPELQEEARQNPGSFKYFKSAVRFVRSDVRLSSEFDCDPETAAQKKAEAETEALAQCEADGSRECRLAGSLVARNGELSCRDFPKGRCPARGHFRGCVGEALALGEKSDLAAGL